MFSTAQTHHRNGRTARAPGRGPLLHSVASFWCAVVLSRPLVRATDGWPWGLIWLVGATGVATTALEEQVPKGPKCAEACKKQGEARKNRRTKQQKNRRTAPEHCRRTLAEVGDWRRTKTRQAPGTGDLCTHIQVAHNGKAQWIAEEERLERINGLEGKCEGSWPADTQSLQKCTTRLLT